MATAAMKVVIGAEVEQFLKDAEKAFGAIEKGAKKMKSVGEDLTKWVTVPILGAATAFTALALESEGASSRLESAVENVGISFDKAQEPISAYLKNLQKVAGFDDEDISDALANLTNITGSAAAGMKALSVTLDLARAKKMDLQSASNQVGKALNGNTEALARYGIKLREGAYGMEVLTALSARFGSTSERFMASAAGKFEQMKNQVENAAEAWGMVLLPMAVKAFEAITRLADMAQRLAGWFSALPQGIQMTAAGLLGVAAAIGPVLVAGGAFIAFLASVKAGLLSLGLAGVAATFGTIGSALLMAAGAMAVLALKATAVLAVFAFFYANGQKLAAGLSGLFMAFLQVFNDVVAGILDGLANMANKVPLVGKKAADGMKAAAAALRIGANAAGMAAQEFADDWEKSGGFIENTTNAVKDAFVSLGFDTKKPLQDMKTDLDALAGAMGNPTFREPPNADPWVKWSESVQVSAQDMASTIMNSFANGITTAIETLADGTFSMKRIWLAFLKEMLAMTVKWALAKLTLFQTVAIAAENMMKANPYLAIAAIAAMMVVASRIEMADGGVVTGPTNALIGEAGPEAVIPLSSSKARNMIGAGGTGSQEIYMMLDGRVIAQAVVEHMPSVVRVQGVFR